LGFGATLHDQNEDISSFLQYAETSDFVKYGFEPEFIGRVPIRVACRSLTADDLAHILTTSEGSILKQYHDDFNGYGISFNIASEVIRKIAEQAGKEGTGARGLMTVLERLFRDFKFELPSSALKYFEVTEEMIQDPSAYLEKLKQQNAHLQEDVLRKDIDRFAKFFEKQHGFRLEFRAPAQQALIEESVEKDRSIQSLCSEKFKDFEHGLSIINRNTGQTVFKIGKLAIRNPDKELSKWVVRSIRNEKSS
jgi:hypothetical protein